MLRSLSRSFNTQPSLLVIGGGPGGYVASIRAAQLGIKTVCVEKEPILGGTCLREGCIPSKYLLHVSEKLHGINVVAKDFGITVPQPATVDLNIVQRKKDAVISGLSFGVKSLLKGYGAELVSGQAFIRDKKTIEVKHDDGKSTVFNPDKLLLATGSIVTSFPQFGIDEKTVITSRTALSLKEIPKSMVVIGGGIVGMELGSVYSKFGTKVTIIDRGNTVGDNSVEKQQSDIIVNVMKKQGVNFILGKGADSVKKTQDGAVVTVGGEDIPCDKVLVAVGRRSNIAGYGLENLGLKMEHGTVWVDEKHETNQKGVFAIGDLTSGPQLAHRASEDGISCVEQIAGIAKPHDISNSIPSVIYTMPQIAHVGINEEEAKKAGFKVKIGKFPYMANSRARTYNEMEGYVKWICDADGTVLGLTIIGPNASEAIMEGTIAIANKLNIKQIAHTCHPHPTYSEALLEAAKAAVDKPIHF